MKERPILFNGDMVRAILDGRKTQTRRMVKFPINADPRYVTLTRMRDGFADGVRPVFGAPDEPNWFSVKSPFGTVGDLLWVRETFSCMERKPVAGCEVAYRADGESLVWEPWTPSIHMPRWASRVTLEITGVRVERVHEISGDDAESEGVDLRRLCGCVEGCATCDDRLPSEVFRDLWQSIYANWDANPWVWVHEFRRVKP